MSDEWKGGGKEARAERNKRIAMERPALIKDALGRLDAIGSVRSDVKGLVEVASQVVKAAEAEILAAEGRALDAEERARQLAQAVRTHLDELTAENERLQSELAAQREIAVAEAVETVQRSERVDVVKTVGAINELAAATEALAAAQRSSMRDTVDILRAIHAHTRDGDERSAIQNMSEFGEWRVVDNAGDTVLACERRSDAVKAVLAQFELEKAAQAEPEPPHDALPDDSPDSPRRRRRGQPGEEHDGYPPPAPAAVDHGVSKRKRNPRIL